MRLLAFTMAGNYFMSKRSSLIYRIKYTSGDLPLYDGNVLSFSTNRVVHLYCK